MYAYEQRIEAVRMVLAYGASYEGAARLLGYPRSPGTIAAWVKEFGERGGLHESYGSCKLHSSSETMGAEVRAVNASDMDIEALEVRKAQLEREVRELEMRAAIAAKAVELLGKGTGGDPANVLTNREKAILVRDLAGAGMRQCDLLAAVGLARSTYNGQIASMGRPDKYAALRPLVVAAFESGGGAYGYRRVKAVLDAAGEVRSEKVIARIMAEEGLVAKDSKARRRRWSSYEGETPGAPPNLVGRSFRSALPNFLWLTDISEFSIPAGKLYLSAIVDCFDGRVVSWASSPSPNADLANSTLEAALARREGWEATVVHSDRGAHYRWPGWVSICEGAGIVRSMSGLGCSPDNSAMEGFFGRMKVEMFYGRDWSRASLPELADEIDAYIGWYNDGRIKLSLGGLSPTAYRESLGMVA